MQRPESVRRRSVLLDSVVLSFIVLLVGCGGGGGGTAADTAAGTGGGAATASSGVGTITGTVIDGSTGAPLGGANVSAGGKTAASQADGAFSIAQVPSGSVQVVGSATGFGSKAAVVFLAANGSAAVNLVLGSSGGGGGGGGGKSATGPKISSSNPSNNGTGVEISTQILFTLDQAIKRSTLAANDGIAQPSLVFTKLTTPSVSDSGPCTVAAFGLSNTFSYTPGALAPLLPGTRYGLTVTNRLVGANGQPSPGSAIAFTTAGSNDTGGGGGGGGAVQTPRISFTSPANAAVNVDPKSRIVFAFDRTMQSATLTTNNTPSIVFTKISPPAVNDFGGQVVIPTDLSVSNVFEYIPGSLGSVGLLSATTYTLFVTNRVLSSAGVPSPGESFSFTVKKEDQGSPPVITNSNPANGATNVDPLTRVFITLSANTDLNTVTPASVKFTQLTTPIGEISTVNVSLSSLDPPIFEMINLPSPLAGNTQYQISVNNNLKNTDGVRSLGSSVSFRTQASSSSGGGPIVLPRLAFKSPLTTDVDPNTRIIFSFDVAMNTGTVTSTIPANVILTQITPPAQDDVPAQIVASPPDLVGIPNVFEYKPGTFSGGLPAGKTFTLFVTNRVLSAAGVPSAGESYTFAVKQLAAGVPPVGPSVTNSNPASGEANVDPSTQIQFTFDRDMFTSNVTRALVPGSTVNPSTVTFTRVTAPSDTDRNLTVTPTNTVTVRLFSGDEAQAIVGAGNPIPLGGVDVLIPGGILGDQLPLIFRPDPVGFPRTFRYVPGTLQVQAGLVEYRLSITNGVRDAQGAAAFTTSRNFITRLATVGPAGGPRLLSANPGTNAFTGAGSRVFLQFDQDLDPASFAGGLGPLAISMQDIAIPGSDTDDPCNVVPGGATALTCDLRPPGPGHPDSLDGDAITCTCTYGNRTGAVLRTVDPKIIEVVPTGALPNGTILIAVTNRISSLPDTNGVTRTAPGDSTWFYVR